MNPNHQITQSNPKDPKILQVECTLQPDGKCTFRQHYSNLNPEQLAKLALYMITELGKMAFGRLAPLVDGVAYTSKLINKQSPNNFFNS